MAQPSSVDKDRIQDHVGRQFGMLITQFLLGMALNLIGTPTNTLATWSQRIILLLHVVLAIVLIVNGVLIFRLAAGSWLQKFARAGGMSVGLAFIFGLLTMAAPWPNLWSFGMAAAFIAAFVVYGRLFLEVKTVKAAR